MPLDVIHILTERAGLQPGPITLTATLAQAGVDSMAVTVLSMVLEDDFNVLIGEKELLAAPTIAALSQLVNERAALV
ncbi:MULTISPECIES: acyl carrier protein [unclassified Streptomyces]|uniref:acyl carrier protein n=1 Tax=unclassified Streptomyces TaxID=2593676 RepID=UPI0033FCA3B6